MRESGGVELRYLVVVWGGVGVLGGGAAEDFVAGAVEGLDEGGDGLVREHAEGDDFGFKAGSLELGGDVLGGRVVFGGTGPVGRGGQDFEVLLGEFGIGDGEEFRIPLGLAGEVAEAEDAGGRRDGGEARGRRLRQRPRGRLLAEYGQGSQRQERGKGLESDQFSPLLCVDAAGV